MAFSSIAGLCVVPKAREVDRNTVRLAQYNELRPVENVSVGSLGSKPNGPRSTSGNIVICSLFFIFNYLFSFVIKVIS